MSGCGRSELDGPSAGAPDGGQDLPLVDVQPGPGPQDRTPGDRGAESEPDAAPAICMVTQVSAGGYTCARKGEGTAWCWGYNMDGQVGDGTTTDRLTPVQVTALGTSVASVAVGYRHACARRNDATVWCWGANTAGQLGDGTMVTRTLPVEVSALGASVIQVETGGSHTCARKVDGTLWCWGNNTTGEVGDGTTTARTVPVQVEALGPSVVDVAVGGGHTCAVKSDGSVWCWGRNTSGEIGDGSTTMRMVPVRVGALVGAIANIQAGVSHTCARKADGTIWCWGSGSYGALGDGTKASKALPTVVAAIGSSVAQVSTRAGAHTCVRKSDGTVWCWGWNLYGQLGDGTTTDATTPVAVTGLGAVVDISAGATHTCARRSDGSIWCWGYNDFGVLGDGTTTMRTAPVAVLGCP